MVTRGQIKSLIVKISKNARIDLEGIILFGSRAKGVSTKSSDYDFILVTKRTYINRDKFRIAKIFRTALAKKMLDVDIIVRSKREMEESRNKIGSVVREALREGISL